MTSLVDSHAHLTDPRFAGEVDAVLERAVEADVRHVITIASNLPDSERAIELSEHYPQVYASAGIHPHEADSGSPAAFARIRELASHPKVVALGETGLDFYYDNSDRENQVASFRRHLELAAELALPAIVHARAADQEVMSAIQDVGWHRGVLHCFSGERPLLTTALERGWYISFAGMITFTKWAGAELLRAVPLDRLLIETDSPYLAPVPYRGKRNEPGHVVLVARRAADLRGESLDALARATTANALELFGIPT